MASSRSARCIVTVKEDLRRITPKRLRFIGWLQRRALMRHSTAWATCTTGAKALLKTKLKRCGGTSLLLPKDINILSWTAKSLTVTITVKVVLL